MGLRERVEEEVKGLNPRLMELSQGEVGVISVDEETCVVTLRVFRGTLIACGINACSLWAEKLLKEAVPEISRVDTVFGPWQPDPDPGSE